MGSRGSVIPFFIEKAKKDNILPITDPEMTRFNISLEEGAEMVLWAIENALGGEIFVPKIPSYKIMTLANAIAPNAKLENIGIRPGEKLHEEMITVSDSLNTIDIGKYYVILPARLDKQKYINYYGGEEVKKGFRYNSGENTRWIDVEEMRSLIKLYVDPDFKPVE
jgi:FlaA1/EpsC-like NDP-sugar epimerase